MILQLLFNIKNNLDKYFIREEFGERSHSGTPKYRCKIVDLAENCGV